MNLEGFLIISTTMLISRIFCKHEDDFYDVLGVDMTATVQEIKHAYRRQVMNYHPDKNGDVYAEEKFIQLTDAYKVLSNKDKRHHYNVDRIPNFFYHSDESDVLSPSSGRHRYKFHFEGTNSDTDHFVRFGVRRNDEEKVVRKELDKRWMNFEHLPHTGERWLNSEHLPHTGEQWLNSEHLPHTGHYFTHSDDQSFEDLELILPNVDHLYHKHGRRQHNHSNQNKLNHDGSCKTITRKIADIEMNYLSCS